MNDVYFHIGYPKSASTTLQKQLFDKHSEITFFGIYPTNNIGIDSDEMNAGTLFLENKDLEMFHDHLTNLEGIEYEFSNVKELYTSIENLLNSKKRNVFSNERFTSVLFAHKDRAEKARRIKNFFPNAKIIIIIRNQLEIIKSQYRDHPFDPRNLYSNRRSVSIDEWIEKDFKNFDISFLQSIEYYKVVSFYSQLFGKENVGVFLFEEFVHDLDQFSNKLSRFMNIDSDETFKLLNSKHENDGVSKNLNSYRRFKATVSRYIPRALKESVFIKDADSFLHMKLKRGKKEDILFKKETVDRIYDFYNKGNVMLENEYSLQLKKYKYIK